MSFGDLSVLPLAVCLSWLDTKDHIFHAACVCKRWSDAAQSVHSWRGTTLVWNCKEQCPDIGRTQVNRMVLGSGVSHIPWHLMCAQQRLVTLVCGNHLVAFRLAYCMEVGVWYPAVHRQPVEIKEIPCWIRTLQELDVCATAHTVDLILEGFQLADRKLPLLKWAFRGNPELPARLESNVESLHLECSILDWPSVSSEKPCRALKRLRLNSLSKSLSNSLSLLEYNTRFPNLRQLAWRIPLNDLMYSMNPNEMKMLPVRSIATIAVAGGFVKRAYLSQAINLVRLHISGAHFGGVLQEIDEIPAVAPLEQIWLFDVSMTEQDASNLFWKLAARSKSSERRLCHVYVDRRVKLMNHRVSSMFKLGECAQTFGVPVTILDNGDGQAFFKGEPDFTHLERSSVS
jgi:hypothetical protein